MKQKESINGSMRGRLPDGTANPIDLHVGKRLKEARIERGMSQGKLAREMGITFQQVQKYEKGMNRIGASRLWDLAQVLGKPISYFYEGLTEDDQNQSPRNINILRDNGNNSDMENLILTPMDIELISYYKKIKDPQVAQNILNLVHSLSLQSYETANADDDNSPNNALEFIDE